MENVTFALPTIGSAIMTAAEQRELINRQATAVIVSSYLQHYKEWIGRTEMGLQSREISETNLVSIINSVQKALNSSTD